MKVARDFQCDRCGVPPGHQCTTGRPARAGRPNPSHKERINTAAAYNAAQEAVS